MPSEAQRDRHKKYKEACKSLFGQIRTQWGQGWNYLGESLQRAIIAEKVLHVFAGRDEESKISAANITEYLQAMWFFCGLETDDDT